MAQSYVQLATDGTGKKIDTQVTQTAAQHRQVMSLGGKDVDTDIALVTATYGLAVNMVATSVATISVGNTVNVAESGAWNVTATIGNTVNVAESGAWNVTATVGNTVNVAQTGSPWGVTATYAAPWSVTATVGAANLAPTAVGGWKSAVASVIASAVTISSAAGKFGGYMLQNNNTSPAFVQIFDTAAVVTLGFTPPTMVLPLPAATTAMGISANLELANGANIANGIKIGVTTGLGVASVVATGVTGTIWYV